MTRPLPVPDEQSAPFWNAAADGVLTIPRCARCGEFTMPPDAVCPHCHSTDPALEFVAVDGAGVVRSWTVIRRPFLPGFAEDVPFVLVDVEMAA
ncbi:MAG: OB-fold domain-containing protein, partial [Nocardia sp.]|nr:OB-fold domain-containing protein [Nocardia sp.]